MAVLPLAADASTLAVNMETRAVRVSDFPLLEEWAYDFERNELLDYRVSGNEALRIWLYWAVTTQKDRWMANSSAYGSEIERMVGLPVSAAIKNSELERTIREAIEQSPYVERINDVRLEVDGGMVTVRVEVTSVYGEGVRIDVEV